MKRYFKALLALILTLGMMLGMGSAASAVPSTVTFINIAEGFEFKPGSAYSSNDLFDGFKNIMPGDKLRETLTVGCANDPYYDYVKIYLKAVPHDEINNPLSPSVAEKETLESMTEFLSKLTMRVWNDGELIYEASPDKTDGLTKYVLIGKFYPANYKTVDIELEIPVTLGNEYIHRIGEVDWVFYAEAYEAPQPPFDPNRRVVTVTKVWDDGDHGIRPTYVNVTLMKDGTPYDTAELNLINSWTYTWPNLDPDSTYEVVEDVPEGYKATYSSYGERITIITNYRFDPIKDDPYTPPDFPDYPPVDPDNPPVDPDDPDNPPVDPDDPDNPPVDPDDPDNPPVDPDDPDNPPVDPDDPDNPPVDPDIPGEPITLTVKKEWAGDEDAIRNRPTQISVTLFNGANAVETVWLGASNNWTFTWDDLDANGNWTVLETDIPTSYVPSYSVGEDGVITITNTQTLIQTGLTRWHIPVVAGVGICLMVFGLIVILKKQKKEQSDE